jgi:hypothetical protein
MYNFLIIATFFTSLLTNETREIEANNLHKHDVKPKYALFEPNFDKKKVLWSVAGITTCVITAVILYKYDSNIRYFIHQEILGGGVTCQSYDGGYGCTKYSNKGYCSHELWNFVNLPYSIFKILTLGFLGYKTYTNIEKFNEGRRPQYLHALQEINRAKKIHNLRILADEAVTEVNELQKTIQRLEVNDCILINQLD